MAKHKSCDAVSVPTQYERPDLSLMQGYASRMSAAPEDYVGFRLTTGAANYKVTFRRAGRHGSVVGERADMSGRIQVCPDRPWEEGCDWDTDFYWIVPEGSPSGIYTAECTDTNDKTFHVPLIVKPRFDRKADVAVLASTNTWHAYNGWGGMSAYSDPCARTLSLDRPMPTANPVGEGINHLTRAELWIIDWLTDAGYPSDVYSDIDFHRDWDWLKDYKALVVSTHSEYWSEPMCDNLDAYLESGGSLLYLSGNGVYWKVTYDSTCRVMEIRKDGKPHYQNGEEGGQWRNLGRPEHSVLGVGYARPGYMTFAPYKVEDASHWVFNDTGLANGDLVGTEGINGGPASGWENDQVREDWSPEGLHVLARGLNAEDYMPPGKRAIYPEEGYEWDGSGGAHMTYYDHPGGGGIFSVGSIAFGGSLVVDGQLQKMVANLLDRFLKR